MGWVSLLLLAAISSRAQRLPDSLSSRLRDLSAATQEVTARECDALAQSIAASDNLTLRQRAAGLDQLRGVCTRKLAWTDPALVRVIERLVANRRALVSEEPAALCTALRALGFTYQYLSRLDETLGLYQEAVAISRRYLGRGTTDEDLAGALESLSDLLLDQRSLHEALAAAEESLRLRRRAVPFRPEQVVTALVARARIEEQLDLTASRATLLKARALCQELGPGHEAEASRVANNLGDILYRLGDLPRAITLLQEAESLRSGDRRDGAPAGGAGAGGSGGQPARQLASTQRTLGEVFYGAGDYPRAIEYYRKAVSGHRDWLGEEPERYGDAVTGLATVLEASGQWEEALALHRDALAIREAALRSAPAPAYVKLQLLLARSLTRMGALQRRMGGPEGRPSLERALAIEEGVLAGAANADHAESLLELADYLREAGDLPRARDLVNHSLQELTSLGEQGPLRLRATEIAGRVADDPTAGLRTLEEARRLAGRLYGAGSPWAASILQARAELRLRQSDAAGALGDALLAQQLSLPHVRTIVQAFPRDQALAFAANRRQSLDLALRLVAEHPGLAANRDGSVWQVAASSRMLVLNAEIDRQKLLQATADPQLAAEAWRLAGARERFAHLLVRGEIATAVHRNQLRASRRELMEAETALAAKLRHRLPSAEISRVSLHELRHRLPAGAVLVAFFQYRRPAGSDAYVAFVLNRTGPPCAISLGPVVEIDFLIEQWRDAILSADSDAAARTRAGQALRQSVWDPIARRVGAARAVFVVPDGALHLVPLMALPTRSGSYLIEQGWAFHTLTAERDLRAPESPRRPGSWLAVGGIDFDRATPQVALAAATPVDVLRGGASPAGSAKLPGADDCRGVGLPRFGALPGSREEIDDLTALWRRLRQAARASSPLTVLTGQDATKQAFRGAVRGQRLIHLATHGFAVAGRCSPARPAARGIGGLTLGEGAAGGELDRLAGLVLAGANDRAGGGRGGQDGILTEAEILDLDMSAADWVVLSTCESGLGTIKAGEGVVGMLRAFQVAGARTVVVSLWSIDDQAAHDWMRELYRARFERRLSTIDAVRQAALGSLRLARKLGDDNPARWAGFVATGQWH